jgi:hypothetical protein
MANSIAGGIQNGQYQRIKQLTLAANRQVKQQVLFEMIECLAIKIHLQIVKLPALVLLKPPSCRKDEVEQKQTIAC